MGLNRVQARRPINDAAAMKQADTENATDKPEIPLSYY